MATRLQAIQYVKAAVIAYPETVNQLKTFAVINREKEYDADNLGKTFADIEPGDFWQRGHSENGFDVNTISNVYPCVTMSSNGISLPKFNKMSNCIHYGHRWLIEVSGLIRKPSDVVNDKAYLSISQLDNILIGQSLWLLNYLKANLSAKFDSAPEITLGDYGNDLLRIASFEIVFDDSINSPAAP